jgi:electron transfer flavoprotein beta subunit
MPTEKRKGGQKFEGEPAEVTAKVVDLLVNEAKVL